MSKSPKPAEIRHLRETYGLSQSAAAAIGYSTLRTWQNWEAGTVAMHPAIWAWFKHSVTHDQKPTIEADPPEKEQKPLKYARHDIQFWWHISDRSIHVTAPHGTTPKLHTTFKNDPESDRHHRSMFNWLKKMLEAQGKPAPKDVL